MWMNPWHRHRDPFFDTYHQLRRQMDDLILPAMHMIHQPRTILPQDDPNKFEVKLDVENFAPEEVKVKMVDNFMVIEAKHEERPDEHGFVSRQFVRRYSIPPDVKQEEITCNLSSDGILVLAAPRHLKQVTGKERPIPITFTGQPSIPEKERKALKEGKTVEGHGASGEPIIAAP